MSAGRLRQMVRRGPRSVFICFFIGRSLRAPRWFFIRRSLLDPRSRRSLLRPRPTSNVGRDRHVADDIVDLTEPLAVGEPLLLSGDVASRDRRKMRCSFFRPTRSVRPTWSRRTRHLCGRDSRKPSTPLASTESRSSVNTAFGTIVKCVLCSRRTMVKRALPNRRPLSAPLTRTEMREDQQRGA